VLIRSSSDPLFSVEMHRHFTHSLLAAPVIGALIATVLTRLVDDSPGWLRVWLCATLGAISAGLLDACTSYGTHLFWPFSDVRIAWSVVSVIDPFLTPVLGACVIAALWRDTNAWASAGIATVACYLALGSVQHERAEWGIRSLAGQRGHHTTKVVVKPTLGNLVVWRGIYVAENQYWIDAVRVAWPGTTLAYPGSSISPANTGTQSGLSSVQRTDVDRFTRLSEGFVVTHPDHPNVLGDIRYAMQPNGIRPLWGIELNQGGPAEHVRWRTFRAWDAVAWERFTRMLWGDVIDEPIIKSETTEKG
ncbi:MAG: metal-dependent hydrolase, partial [Chromatiales bacterium]|nr:metal-dependent hydrolase [Chromatiales bacterium]